MSFILRTRIKLVPGIMSLKHCLFASTALYRFNSIMQYLRSTESCRLLSLHSSNLQFQQQGIIAFLYQIQILDNIPGSIRPTMLSPSEHITLFKSKSKDFLKGSPDLCRITVSQLNNQKLAKLKINKLFTVLLTSS